jgi:hypothetical protein
MAEQNREGLVGKVEPILCNGLQLRDSTSPIKPNPMFLLQNTNHPNRRSLQERDALTKIMAYLICVKDIVIVFCSNIRELFTQSDRSTPTRAGNTARR